MRPKWFIIGGLIFILLISLGTIVRLYTDFLWFGEVGLTSVFWTVFWTRWGVGVAGAIVAGLFVWVNLDVARRVAPQYRFVPTGGADVTEQYRALVRPYVKWANLGVAGLVGVLTGLSTAGAWERVLLWLNARPFGVQDPQFGRDASFYVFSIPLQRSVLAFGFGIVVVSIFLAALAHLLHGSIQPEPNRVRVASSVKVHASVLLGFIALLKGWAYWLDRFELVYSTRGPVQGATFTDVNAQLPALNLLVVIAVVAAIIFFVNLRFRGWLLPGAAIGLWLFTSVLAGALVPAAVQRFQVLPAQSQREAPYIERNIEMTRAAYGIDRFDQRTFPAADDLDPETLEANAPTIENLRIWDPVALLPTYRRLQAIRPYYDFEDVDIARYRLDGESITQVMTAAREIDPTGLSPEAQNWVNLRLAYTHGFGMVANPANSLTAEGQPELIARDLPPRGDPLVTPGDTDRGGIYFGETTRGWVVANSEQPEIQFPVGEDDQTLQTTHYEGVGGVEVRNLLRRAAFAWRFADLNMLISDRISTDSRVITRRNILERASEPAPFLRFDRDPYLVVADGELKWIMDAYTETDRFPYSQTVLLDQPFQGGQQGAVNYMRNSVKVVIDAYDGTMDYYLMEPDDALAATYEVIFPDLFTPADEMPDAIREHIRYPVDLFTLQAWVFRVYHLLDAQRVFARDDVWDIPRDPVDRERIMLDPYYTVMKLPGEDEEEFILMIPFTPRERPILNAWMAARSDGEHYGEVVAFGFPRGTSIDGPATISARIDQNDVISEQFTLWDRAGSNVVRGSMFVIPIGNSLIYLQPVYLEADAEGGATALPELRRVIVVIGDQIGFEPTVEASIESAMLGRGVEVVDPEDEELPIEDPDEPVAEPLNGEVAELLQEAINHFEAAEQALRRGDLATYQRENEAGRRSVEEAQQRQQQDDE